MDGGSIRRQQINRTNSSCDRVIGGVDAIVRVDLEKARAAMEYAMAVREESRAKDGERDEFVRTQVAT